MAEETNTIDTDAKLLAEMAAQAGGDKTNIPSVVATTIPDPDVPLIDGTTPTLIGKDVGQLSDEVPTASTTTVDTKDSLTVDAPKRIDEGVGQIDEIDKIQPKVEETSVDVAQIKDAPTVQYEEEHSLKELSQKLPQKT